MLVRQIAAAAGAAAGRIVLLPGVQQTPEHFVAAGFDAAVLHRGLPLDVFIAVPALASLTDRRWIDTLRHELIEPQRAAAPLLWLGGISLGAFMALRFAADHAALLDGLCLIAPYLGSRIVAAEVARNGIQAWRPSELPDADDEYRIWRYVRDLGPPPPRLFLGLSRADRFADTQRLLAQAVPASCRCEIEGPHEWPVWRELWDNFLERWARGDYAAA